ncbi:MAG: Mth938-like domain-containing protein [Rhodoferax sp.]
MKLQPDKSSVQSITGYGAGWISVDGERIQSSVILTSGGLREPWDCRAYGDLASRHFSRLADLDVELVIFGSGGRIRFPPPDWLRGLFERRVGLETMDTQAACRTYNILAGEGRRVAAALLIENTAL